MCKTILALMATFFLVSCDDEDLLYADGTKWEPVVPLSPGRISPRAMDDRQWATFVARAGIQADANVKTFTPDWLFFSSVPAGEISYLDFGSLVAMWVDTATLGTSNDQFMAWDVGSIPENIRPNSQRVVNADVADNTVNTYKGAIIIDSDGSATFSITQVSGVNLIDVGNAFTSANQKGLPAGWLVMYSKR